MKSFEIHIQEKRKIIKKLSFLNLNNEIVSIMYNKTIAASSRKDLIFFILIFFLSLKQEGKSFLYLLFEKNISKLKDLNKEFSRAGILKKGEYAEIKERLGLSDLLQYDVLFLLIKGVLEKEYFIVKFSSFFIENPDLKEELEKIDNMFFSDLSQFYKEFSGNKIKDDRYDDNGEYHDLSKSIYRMVKMRLNKNLNISIQQFSEIKSIESKSPIDLTFIQNVDPEIIFLLWEKYHLSEYLSNVFSSASEYISFDVDFGDLIVGWMLWKTTDGKKNKKEKQEKKEAFEVQKKEAENNSSLIALNTTLVNSILKSKENLEKEVNTLKEKVRYLENKTEKTNEENKLYKSILKEIIQLENLEIEIIENIDE